MPASLPAVSLARCAHYDAVALTATIREVLAPLGGMGAFVRRGQRVLLKPNFVAARPADEACNTHPEFILAVAHLVHEQGAEAVVGDSPAMGTVASVARKLDAGGRFREAGLPLMEFSRGQRVRSELGDCTVPIAREVAGADALINLPKLKTHQQVGMTCCVKNLYGCVAGRRKAFLHFWRGGDPDRFGGMLLDVADLARPTLNLVDGIVAMHRGGPIRGEPIPFGAVLAGADPVAVDTVAFHLAGAEPKAICSHRAAMRAGRAGATLGAIDLRGTPLVEMPCPRLEPPPLMMPLNFSPWHIIRGWLRHQFRMRCAASR